MKLFRKDEGFTLVELMVVVLIIGILVAIAIPVFNAAKANAQKKSCFASQRTIEGAAQTFAADDTSGLPASSVTQLVPAYIKVAPICPASRAGYAMDASGTVTSDMGTAGGWYGGTAANAHTHFE
jgi:prepilin-type N-terminal cleavage/methylation domain-containing protein